MSSAPKPSGVGCVECSAAGDWWFHLRRCVACGHIGCCDTSPHQHATAHFKSSGHALIASFEPGEDWFFDFTSGDFADGPKLPEPTAHPPEQPVPGPVGRVPKNWQSKLHA